MNRALLICCMPSHAILIITISGIQLVPITLLSEAFEIDVLFVAHSSDAIRTVVKMVSHFVTGSAVPPSQLKLCMDHM